LAYHHVESSERERNAGDTQRVHVATHLVGGRSIGKHRLSRRTTAVTGGVAGLVVAGTVAAVMVGSTSSASANENDWNRLRQCESGNNYSTNTGNGYYGAYQFDLGTWRGVGGSGLPSNASKAEQDSRARALYRARGWSPWECASILGLRPDPSNGYAPVTSIKPTIAAPTSRPAGAAAHLSGRATPGARVVVYSYQVGLWKTYHPIATVKANSGGRWAHNVAVNHTSRYYVTASGKKSGIATTRYLYRTGIYAASSRTVNQKFSIVGNARPDSVVTLYFRRAGGGSFVKGTRVRADHRGHYQAGWRARTDYQFFARSDTQSATGTTRIATTATGPASVSAAKATAAGAATPAAGGETTLVPLHGTARPGSLVRIYVRHAGQHAWRSVAAVHARRSGAWAVSLKATSTFTYFARSSTHQQSAVHRSVVQ
jgi:hypothetical protein